MEAKFWDTQFSNESTHFPSWIRN